MIGAMKLGFPFAGTQAKQLDFANSSPCSDRPLVEPPRSGLRWQAFRALASRLLLLLALLPLSGCLPSSLPDDSTEPTTSASDNDPASSSRNARTKSQSNVAPSSTAAVAKPNQRPAGKSPRPQLAPATWTQFRGSRSGVHEAEMPLSFQPNHQVWKTQLPGRGASTPIVVGDKIITTAYSGFGISAKEPGSLDALRHHVICVDANTGRPLWHRVIQGNAAISKRVSENLRGHGFASSSPASDGKSVFAFFGVSGVFAFDLDGNFLWQNDVGWREDNFGSSASLTVVDDKLIVNASIESEAIYAFDTQSGRGVWKIDDVLRSWSTPVVGKSSTGRKELIVSQKDVVRGFDPATGVELWSCEGIHDYIVPTPVVFNGVVYLNGGKQSRTLAIKLGGQGVVSKTHRLWEARFGANIGSPVVYNGMVFNVFENGIVQCYNAKDGKVLKRQRIKGAGVVHASPTLVLPQGGNAKAHLLVTLPENGVVVLEAAPQLNIVATNVVEANPSAIRASFAVHKNRWITRNDDYLFCIGSQANSKTKTIEMLPASSDLIASHAKFDLDTKTGRIKPYNRCLETDTEKLVTFFLFPYKSVLTDEQNTKFRQLIVDNKPTYLQLRKRRHELFWQQLATPPATRSAKRFEEQAAQLESETMATQRDLRMVIKRQFTPEQLKQHMEESKR